MSSQVQTGGVVRFGVFEVDFAAAELRKRGRRVKLEAQPFQVLRYLLQRPGELVTRDELRNELWPADTFVEFDHSLNTAVKKIRQALDDSPRNPRCIETVPRQGYRFIAAVDGGGDVGVGHARPLPRWLGSLALVAVVVAAITWFAVQPEPASDAPLQFIPLTTYPGDEQRPSFSPDGDEVAFQWNRDGNWDIFIKQIGVEEPFQLTNDPADELGPAWSPVGNQIAFVRVLSEPARTQVILAPQRGGQERILTEFQAHFEWFPFIRRESGALAWTPDGEWLVVAGKDEPQERLRLFRVSARTGERIPLTSPEGGRYGDKAPAVSPDGQTLVFIRDLNQLWALPLAADCTPSDRPKRLSLSNQRVNYPAWTQDGREILFQARYHDSRLRRLVLSKPEASVGFLVPSSTSFHPAISGRRNRMAYAADSIMTNIWQVTLSDGEERLPAPVPLIRSTRNDYDPAYSPDGQRIAFSSSRSGTVGIWVSNSDGTEPAELVSLGRGNGAWRPRWSPDGTQITFQGTVELNQDIYVVKKSGGVPRRLTTYPGPDENPEWSYDGKWIYFLSHRDGTKRTWKMPAAGGEPVPMDVPGGLISESPDGKFLYYDRNWETPEKFSIWRVPVAGGESVQVPVSLSHTLAADVVKDGIYYIGRRRRDGTSQILFRDFNTGELETVAVIKETTGWGLSVSPDRKTLLFVQEDRSGSDLMLVENFR